MITGVGTTIRVILDTQFLEEVEGSDQARSHPRSAKYIKSKGVHARYLNWQNEY